MKNRILKNRRVCLLFLCASFFSTVIQAQSVMLPRVLNFNAVLTDAGGTPLPNGAYEVTFRITDLNNNELYVETQKLESVKGVVSAMIGEQSELPISLFQTSAPRFLNYSVAGETSESRMEIVSVPYAMVAEEAQSVAPQSIKAESIQPGAITRDLLSEELIAELTTQVAPEALPQEVVLTSELETFRGSLKAGDIGIESDLVYSRGANVANVLKDFDTAIHQKQLNLERASAELGSSLGARVTQEVNNLQTSIANTNINLASVNTNLSNDLANTNTNLTNRINGVVSDVNSADVAINNRIGNLEQKTELDINTAVGGAVGAIQSSLDGMPKIRAWGSSDVAGNIKDGYNVLSTTLMGNVASGVRYHVLFEDPLQIRDYAVSINPNGQVYDRSENGFYIFFKDELFELVEVVAPYEAQINFIVVGP